MLTLNSGHTLCITTDQSHSIRLFIRLPWTKYPQIGQLLSALN